jgi:hypothetical protein
VNASMLSQWMLGRYKGNVARVRSMTTLNVFYWTGFNPHACTLQINGLMEAWLIRRRGGKPMDKSVLSMCSVVLYYLVSSLSYCAFSWVVMSTGTSPKLKRRFDEIAGDVGKQNGRRVSTIFAQRKLYAYPKVN